MFIADPKGNSESPGRSSFVLVRLLHTSRHRDFLPANLPKAHTHVRPVVYIAWSDVCSYVLSHNVKPPISLWPTACILCCWEWPQWASAHAQQYCTVLRSLAKHRPYKGIACVDIINSTFMVPSSAFRMPHPGKGPGSRIQIFHMNVLCSASKAPGNTSSLFSTVRDFVTLLFELKGTLSGLSLHHNLAAASACTCNSLQTLQN